MGVKVYSLNEAPETPSPEIEVGDVAIGEAYENVSMLEFALLVHDHEQNMFEAVIATDFMEAVDEQVMLEADGEEAPAADAGEAAAEKKPSKLGGIVKSIKAKILELLEAFKKKLNAFVQKVRIKFGDLLKQDKKIADNFEKIKPDNLKDFKAPNINYKLVQKMFGANNSESFSAIGNQISSACKNTTLHIEKLDSLNSAEEINAEKEKVINGMNNLSENLAEFAKSFGEYDKDGKEASRREVAGGKTGVNTQVINIDRAIVHATFNGEVGYKSIEKSVSEQIETLNKMISLTKKVLNDDSVDELDKVRANAINEMATKLLGVISKFNSEMTTAYSHAYADVRKYALSAISYANKGLKAAAKAATPEEDKAEEAKQEAAQWALCEASDEYVFSALALI